MSAAPIPFHRREFSLRSETGHIAGLEAGPESRLIDLVFCHANGFNARTYASILAPLAEDFHILAIDMRGHGLSTLSAEVEDRAGWSQYGDDLAALLDAEDMRDVTLAGHSMGGIASLLAAATRPERVRNLVLFDPVMLAPENTFEGQVPAQMLVEGAQRRRARFADRLAAIDNYRGRGAFKHWSEAMLADYVEDGFRDLPEGGVALACEPAWEASNFELSRSAAPWRVLPKIAACPVTILRADNRSTCEMDGRELDELPGNISIETLSGTTHFLPMERPELVVGELRAAISAG